MIGTTAIVSFDNISYQPVIAPTPCFSLVLREQGAAGTTSWLLRRPGVADADFKLLPGEGFTFVQSGAGIGGQILGYVKLIDVASADFSMSAQ